jgi:hypothetical protein
MEVENIMGVINEYRVRAAVGRPKPDPALLTFGQTVSQKVTAGFNPPPPSLAELNGALPAFATAIQDAKTQKGTAAALTEARQGVINALNHVRNDIDAIAQKQPPDQGKATIESAGLKAKKIAVRVKPPLAAKYGGVSGVVVLVALAVAKGAMYFWQVSTDQAHWTDCPSSNTKSMTTLVGLTPGTLYYFRFRAQTRKGMGDWSPSVSLIAH